MARQEKLTILLIADNFDQQLLPLLTDCPWSTRCFASKCILDLSLEWISQVDVPNIIIVSSSVELKILEDVKGKWKECFQSFIIVHLPNRMSVGDIMREIDAKSLLSGDFILIDNPATFSSSNLSKQITNFKKLRQRNKNNVMSLLYSRSEIEACQTIGFHAESGKLVLYNSRDDIPTYSLIKSLFKTDSFVRSDLAPTGITFCALEILPLFSDNFDFLDLDDVIRDILINEEVHCRNIYIDVLPEKEVAIVAHDYNSLLRCNRLLIQRWCFPLAFDFADPGNGQPRLHHSMHHNIYAHVGQEWPQTATNSIFGQKCQIADGVVLDNCSFGDSTVIGPSSSLNNIIAGKNLKVGKNCQLQESILSENVILGDDCQVKRCSFIGSNVTIPSHTTIPSYSIILSLPPSEDDEDTINYEKENGYYKWYSINSPKGRFWRSSRRALSPSRSRSRDRSRTYSGRTRKESSPEPPTGQIDFVYGPDKLGVEIFASETRDSMRTVLESENHASEDHLRKLILEINSSKLAYNISMDNVAKNVFASFLALPPVEKGLSGFKKLCKEWTLIWTNYYKPPQSQTQMLHAIEERAAEISSFQKIVPNIIHFLFNDVDVLNEDVILDWYDNLPEDSPLKELVKPVIEWLREDSDDEDSDKEN